MFNGILSLILTSSILFLSTNCLQAWTTSPPQWVQDLPASGLLPDPLIKSDGTRITSAAEWPAQRNYLISQLKKCITGTFPPLPNISGTIGWGTGSTTINAGGVGISISLRYPSGSSSNKYPVVIGTWNWMDWVYDAPGIGYVGVLITGDNPGGLTSAFPGYTWGELMRRAWVAGAVAKFLKNQSWVDSRYISVTGHSRAGKVALWSAAFFEEITGGAPNMGGVGGEVPVRYSTNEYNTEVYGPATYVGDLIGGGSTGFFNFHGRENKLPVDENTLAAICAPRAVILGTAVNDILGGPWGITQSYHSAKKVYDLLGVPNKIGVRMDWGSHHYDYTALAAYCQFFNYAWGRTTSLPTDQYVNLFRYSYTFEKWKTDNPSQQINPLDHPIHPSDMSDILKNSTNATITTTSEWEQKKKRFETTDFSVIGNRTGR